MLAFAMGNRVVQSLVVGWVVTRDRGSLLYCWLYPLRDLLGFGLWAWSFVGGRNIVWRGQKYRLLRGGQMVREGALTPNPPRKPERPEPARMSR
jgi:ceramide glucosyltransferase